MIQKVSYSEDLGFGQPVLSAPSTSLPKQGVHQAAQQQAAAQQLQGQGQMQQMVQWMQIPGQGLVAVPVAMDPTMQQVPFQLVYQ